MAEERDQILNYKPILQRFVEANEALADCMVAVPKEDLSGMSAAQLDSHCQREKIAVKSILESNQMTMTQVVKDRLNVMRTLKEIGVPSRVVEEDF